MNGPGVVISRQYSQANLIADTGTYNTVPLGELVSDEYGIVWRRIQVIASSTNAGSAGRLMYSGWGTPHVVTDDYSAIDPAQAAVILQGVVAKGSYGWGIDINYPFISNVLAASGLAVASGFPIIVSSTDGKATGAASALSLVAKRIGRTYAAKVSGTTVLKIQGPCNGF